MSSPFPPSRIHLQVVLLPFSTRHASSYNELVETVQRNLLLADWFDPGHVESLLNPRQWKLARNTLVNVRLSCCVAGHMNISDLPGDIDETMETLEGKGLHPLSDRYAKIRAALKMGGNCER